MYIFAGHMLGNCYMHFKDFLYVIPDIKQSHEGPFPQDTDDFVAWLKDQKHKVGHL